jgi:hypothetical protein
MFRPSLHVSTLDRLVLELLMGVSLPILPALVRSVVGKGVGSSRLVMTYLIKD